MNIKIFGWSIFLLHFVKSNFILKLIEKDFKVNFKVNEKSFKKIWIWKIFF